MQILPSGSPKKGESVQWHTVTPPSGAIEIVQAVTPVNEVLVDPNLSADGFAASFFWSGGSQAIWPVDNCCGGMYYGAGINRSLVPSRWFGWQVTCVTSACVEPSQILDVRGVQLVAVDNTPPGMVALGSDNLWYQSGHYVRGAGWSASFQASADDGICGMQALVDGQSVQGPSDPSPDQHSWTQCPDPQTMALTVDTGQYPDGPLSLTLSARDAASPANVSSPTETLHIDNQPVGLSLSGPTAVSVTAGTQYVTATASAGPSGVSIACSTDGSPYQWHAGANAQIPVQGLGDHVVRCYAQNNAIDPAGAPATSPVQAWTISIREPTVVPASFEQIVAPRCAKVRERVKMPARWVIRHHKLVHKRAYVKTVHVLRCDAPHVVQHSKWRVRHGQGVQVSGWLGTAAGDALAGQTVSIITAPDNALNQFTQAAVATTAANGTWTAALAPGPSRLVEAAYGGGATLEPATPAAIKLTVPALIFLRITPRWVPWTGRIVVSGQLKGGYVPPDGVALRLRVGYPGGPVTVHALRSNLDGRFRFTWSFGSGSGIVHWPLWISTISNESDYAFAAATSSHVTVTFGGHPPGSRRRRHS